MDTTTLKMAIAGFMHHIGKFPDKDLLDNCSRFYNKEKSREDGELGMIGIPKITVPDGNGKRFLIRLGRHSGAESVTIEGYRNIRIMTGRGQRDRFEDHATTLWLASGISKPKSKDNLKPFGWALLEEMTVDQALEFEQKEKGWQKLHGEERAKELAIEKNHLEERLEQIEKIKEEEKIKVRAEQIKEEEQQRRKAELEAMSPEDRDISAVKDPSTTEYEVIEIYNRIDEFSTENRAKLAQALKENWINNEKWEGKLSKKQKSKVEKIKRILGDA